MLFDARVTTRQRWTVLSVVGDVDLATMPVLSQRFDEVHGDQVALDLSGVDHLDPVTFGVVLVGALRAHRRGALFAVVCPQGRPRELFAETGLDQVLTVVATFEDLLD